MNPDGARTPVTRGVARVLQLPPFPSLDTRPSLRLRQAFFTISILNPESGEASQPST